LVLFCERREATLRLQAALQKERPQPYAEAFGPIVVPPTTRKPRDPRRVFISYSTKDADFATRLARDLRATGLSVWIAADSIAQGELWAAAIDRGLSECGIFVVALTPNAVGSGWVKIETAYALQARQCGQMQLFPLLVQACEVDALSSLLTTVQQVNFERDYDAGFAALCRVMGVAPPASPSPRLENSSASEPHPSERRAPTQHPPAPAAPASKLEQAFTAALASKNWAEAQRRLTHWQTVEFEQQWRMQQR
jgi:hypothetical protein